MALGALGAACTLTLDSGASATPSAPLTPWHPELASSRTLAKNASSLKPPPDPAAATVRRMVAAGDRIARLPYTYGGGHGSFDSSG